MNDESKIFYTKKNKIQGNIRIMHKKSYSKTESIFPFKNNEKINVSIKNNNIEIAEKLKLSKLTPSPFTKRSFHFDNNFDNYELQTRANAKPTFPTSKEKIRIPKLNIKQIVNDDQKQIKINKDTILSQRSDYSFNEDNGFLSARPRNEFLLTRNLDNKQSPKDKEHLKRDISYILDQKKKKKSLKNDINIISNFYNENETNGLFSFNNNIINEPQVFDQKEALNFEFLSNDIFEKNKASIPQTSENCLNPTPKRFLFLDDLTKTKITHIYSSEILQKFSLDFKKIHPNLCSNSPPGRKEAILLKEWVSTTINTVFEDNNIPKKDKFLISDEIFSFSLCELIRQISFDCLERGELFTFLWKNYVKLFQKIFLFEEQEKIKIKEEQEAENLKYSKIFRDEIVQKDLKLSEQQEIINNLNKKISQMKKEIEKWKETDKLNCAQNEKIRKISEQLFLKSKKLKYENEEMKSKIMKYSEQFQKIKFFNKASTSMKLDSLNSLPKNDDYDSDIESNPNIESENLKDIMRFLGEETFQNEENLDEKAKKNRDLENPIIIKCFQEQKEKILISASTEIDEDIKNSYFQAKGVQTELNLLKEKYDSVLTNEILEETLTERALRKNLLKFQVENKRTSIQKFVHAVDEVKKRSSVVSELLNCLSPSKKSNIMNRPVAAKKNSVINLNMNDSNNNNSNNISVTSSECEKEINEQPFNNYPSKKKIEHQETIEIQVDLPVKAKTLLEKRNSVLYELSKKIVGSEKKSSKFKEKNDEFNFDLPSQNSFKIFDEIKENNKCNQTEAFQIHDKENVKKKLSDLHKDEKKEELDISNNSIKIPSNRNEVQRKSLNNENKININDLEIKIPILNILNQEEEETISSNQKNIGTSPRNIQKTSLKQSKNLSNFSPNSPKNNFKQRLMAKSNKKSNESQGESPKNKMKSSFMPFNSKSIKNNSNNNFSSNKNLSEEDPISPNNLRDIIKEKNAADFLENYLGSTLDKLLENSNEKQQFSIQLPKNIITKLNKSREENESDENNENEEELKNKILDIIQLFQLETQKNDDLLSIQELLKHSINNLIDFIKKILGYLKEKGHLEKYDEFYKIFLEMRSKIPKNFDSTYENEVKESNRKKIMRKTRNITKFFLVPKLGTVSKTPVIDKENHSGIVICKKIQNLGKFKNSNKFLHQKQTLKLITQIYDEKLVSCRDNPQNKELEMQIFAFNLFLNRYGMKKVAERKFTEFLLSVKHYSHVFRISTFAKMINILDGNLSYSVDEMKKYLEGLEFLTEICTNGSTIIHEATDMKRYVPFVRAVDFLRLFSENKLSFEEIAELRKEIDGAKENDPKNINKNGIIDMDIYLSKVLIKYRHIMNKTKKYVVNAFNACDLDGNKMCNLSEFVLLYRHIEKEKFNEEKVVKLFEEQADLVTNSEKNMSFDKFTAICVDFQLFSDIQQIKFIGISQFDQSEIEVQKNFEELVTHWSVRKMKIEGKLTLLKSNLEKEDFDNWMNILITLESRVLNKQENMETKPMLIAYKIMDGELDRLIKQKEEMEIYEEVEVEEEN